jgi:hypothetical protein
MVQPRCWQCTAVLFCNNGPAILDFMKQAEAMSDSQSIGALRSADQRVLPSRKRLAMETTCLAWLAAIATSTVQTLIWDHEERVTGSLETYSSSPASDLPSMLVCMPFGFILYTLLPPGWLFWVGFASTLWNRDRGNGKRLVAEINSECPARLCHAHQSGDSGGPGICR